MKWDAQSHFGAGSRRRRSPRVPEWNGILEASGLSPKPCSITPVSEGHGPRPISEFPKMAGLSVLAFVHMDLGDRHWRSPGLPRISRSDARALL